MEIDENSDGNNVGGGDEENELMRKIESKKRNLKREQDRLNQMRFLIQKLMFSGSFPWLSIFRMQVIKHSTWYNDDIIKEKDK